MSIPTMDRVRIETPARSLDTLLAKSKKPATHAALEACKRHPSREHWLAAEKLAWGDVRLDTMDCLWLREQGVGSLS